MTLTLRAAYPAAHRTRTRIARAIRWLADWLGGGDKIVHLGVTEATIVVVDPEPRNALDPAWAPFAPDLLPAVLFEQQCDEQPIDLNWQPSWLDFTASYRAIAIHDEELARV